MISLQRMHHIATITSDYTCSKYFYCQVPGFTLIGEYYCAERDSWKRDLALQGDYLIELFSFPGALGRLRRLEAQGLRPPDVNGKPLYLAFSVADIDEAIASLKTDGVACEPVQVDALTSKKFTFFYRSRSVTAGAV